MSTAMLDIERIYDKAFDGAYTGDDTKEGNSIRHYYALRAVARFAWDSGWLAPINSYAEDNPYIA